MTFQATTTLTPTVIIVGIEVSEPTGSDGKPQRTTFQVGLPISFDAPMIVAKTKDQGRVHPCGDITEATTCDLAFP